MIYVDGIMVYRYSDAIKQINSVSDEFVPSWHVVWRSNVQHAYAVSVILARS